MNKVLITESSLRELLRELMNSHAPIFPNPVIDPQAAETDPTNLNFIPTDKVELISALRMLVGDIDDESVPEVYITIKDSIEKKEDEMKKNVDLAESVVRNAVRKLLQEYFIIDPVTGEKVWKGAGPAPKLAPSAGVQKIDPLSHGKEFEDRREKSVKGLRSKLASMQDEKESQLPDLSGAFKVSKSDADLYMKIYNEAYEELKELNPSFDYRFVTEEDLFHKKFKEQFLNDPSTEKFGAKNWRNYALNLGKEIKENLARLTGKKNVVGDMKMKELAQELGVSVSTINNIDATSLAKLTLAKVAEEQ